MLIRTGACPQKGANFNLNKVASTETGFNFQAIGNAYPHNKPDVCLLYSEKES
jgi:hypothetical protein